MSFFPPRSDYFYYRNDFLFCIFFLLGCFLPSEKLTLYAFFSCQKSNLPMAFLLQGVITFYDRDDFLFCTFILLECFLPREKLTLYAFSSFQKGNFFYQRFLRPRTLHSVIDFNSVWLVIRSSQTLSSTSEVYFVCFSTTGWVTMLFLSIKQHNTDLSFSFHRSLFFRLLLHISSSD